MPLPCSMRFTKKQRMLLIAVSLCIGIVALIINSTYRPYIYSNHINDWHLADSFPNFLAVPACQFMMLGLSKNIKLQLHTQFITICSGLIFYEFIGLTFDYFDMAATIISGFIFFTIESISIKARCKNSDKIDNC